MTDSTVKLVVNNDNALTPAENAVLDAEVIKHDSELGLRMLGQVHQFIGRFVAYPSDHAHVAHALWIVHTHLMDKWDSTPRIAFLSAEPASGKSRALEITNLLVPRPMQAVNMSPAALFRSVGSEDGLPTILFDEIDTLFGPKAKENEEIRGLFNAGHRRGQKAYRAQIRGADIGVEAIEAFSALAVAGLGWLPDTIMSRSVIIRMRRRHPGERVEGGTSGTSGTSMKTQGSSVPDDGDENTGKSNDVPDVPYVPDLSANGCGDNVLELPPELDRRPRRCVNCMRGDLANDPLLEVDDGRVHWLHRSCLDAWKRHHKT